jgi:predicted aspartyl protease
VHGVSASALVDTGVSINVIREDLWKRIQVKWKKKKLKSSRVKIRGFATEESRSLGKAKVTVRIHSLSQVTYVHVLPNLAYDVIIGMNLMKKMISEINLEEGFLLLKNGKRFYHEGLSSREDEDPLLRDVAYASPKVITVDQAQKEFEEDLKVTMQNLNSELTNKERKMVEDLLREYKEIFLRVLDYPKGVPNWTQHKVETGDAKPIQLRPYRKSQKDIEIEEAEIQRMLKYGIIRP